MAGLAHRGDPQAGPYGRRQRGQFRADPFPDKGEKTAAKADAFLTSARLILRARGQLRPARCLRLTVGTEEANRGGRGACANSWRHDVMFEQDRPDRPRPDRLVHGPCGQARRAGRAHRRLSTSSRGACDSAPPSSALPTSLHGDVGDAVKDADLVILATPVGSLQASSRAAIAPHLKPGAILTDVGSVKSAVMPRCRALRAQGRAFHSRPSHRRHRTFRSRGRLRQPVRRPLVHPDAAARRRSQARSKSSSTSGRAAAARSK